MDVSYYKMHSGMILVEDVTDVLEWQIYNREPRNMNSFFMII